MIIAGAVGIPIAIISAKIGNSQSSKLKIFTGEHVVKDVIAEKLEVTQYIPSPTDSLDMIKKCTLLPRYDRSTISDYIKGTYRGVPLSYCDLHLEREEQDTDDEGHTTTSYRTVFKGHLINLGLGQKIDGFVKIKERKNPRKEKGFLSNVFSGAADLLGIKTKDETIEVENEIFNNQFEITKTVLSKGSLEKSRNQMRSELNRILAVVDEILVKDNLF